LCALPFFGQGSRPNVAMLGHFCGVPQVLPHRSVALARLAA